MISTCNVLEQSLASKIEYEEIVRNGLGLPFVEDLRHGSLTIEQEVGSGHAASSGIDIFQPLTLGIETSSHNSICHKIRTKKSCVNQRSARPG